MPDEGILFEDAAQWEAWLAEYHGTPGGAWLRIAKRGAGAASVTIEEALDVALCYGWIDGQRRSFDGTHYLQKYTRRRPRSSWSRVNVGKAESLIAAGRMRPPGFAEIEAAKADGRWQAAYDSQKESTVPPDLEAALAANDRARTAFEALDKTRRYAVILPLLKARTPEGRAARVHRAVTELANGTV